jgi:hypothetical protein
MLECVPTIPAAMSTARESLFAFDIGMWEAEVAVCPAPCQILERTEVTQQELETQRMDCRAPRHAIRQVANITTFCSKRYPASTSVLLPELRLLDSATLPNRRQVSRLPSTFLDTMLPPIVFSFLKSAIYDVPLVHRFGRLVALV